ncbi:MAG: hypothetical protein JOZ27_02980 [Caulobacteraceae bacterium]|nr:hypothetical protein [Caulobacteraceae bacterium]
MKAWFLGVAGAGMSALASILKSEGWTVEGSDEGVFPPVSDYLTRMGIAWRDGFDAARLPADIDLAIVGGSAKLGLAGNPELAELRRRGVPIHGFPQFLGAHIAARDVALVAGSFGKSTLAALLAVMLRAAGRDPGWFVGAVPVDLPGTGHAGRDPVFIAEGDEYIVGQDDLRSKFDLYPATSLLLSSIVHDHLNVFPTLESYEAPFARLLRRLPPGGALVCARDDEGVRRIVGDRPAVWYGVEPGPGYHADHVRIGETTRFDLVTPGGERAPLETQLIGRHNIENIVAAAAFLLERGDLRLHELAPGVRAFHGVRRRLDKLTTRSRVPVYEGFGSSYEKARSAIDAVLLHFAPRPAVVVFEPHAFSWRNRAALAWYDTVFAGVDRVFLLPPPAHGAEGHDQLSQAEIAARIAAAGVRCESVPSGESVIESLAGAVAGDEVVLLLSSGPLDGLPATLAPRLETMFNA